MIGSGKVRRRSDLIKRARKYFHLDQNDEETNLNRKRKKTGDENLTKSKKKPNTITSKSNANPNIVMTAKQADDRARNSINPVEKSKIPNPKTTNAIIHLHTKNPKNLKDLPGKKKLQNPNPNLQKTKKFKNDQVPRKRSPKRTKKVNNRKSTRK